MTNKDFFLALEDLEKAKGISSETVLSALETALAIACKKEKDIGETAKVVVKAVPEKYSIHVYVCKTVVEGEVEDPTSQITLEQAREIKKSYKVGDEAQIEIFPREFGRIAALNAKQVIMNSLRQAEKAVTYSEFSDKENELIIGVVSRVKEDGTVYVEIGKNQMEGVLAPSEQIPGEKFYPGDKVKALVKRVRDGMNGTQVVLSRSNFMFIKRLFENEVPEIHSGLVEIKSIVREAGFRTKMAVASNDSQIDPVGACVGNKGARVNAIVSEIGGEKIDIIPWSSDILDYIACALSPAKVLIVQADEETKEAKVIVPDEKLSLAIGREGQNARLAARLTGWKIDVKSYSVAMANGMFDEGEQTEEENA